MREHLIAALALATPHVASAQIDGRWITQGGQSVVTIAPCGRDHCGTITRVLKADRGTPTTDVNNPDPAFRSRAIIGLPILTEFVPDGTRWRGQIYDPRSGRTYKSFLEASGTTLKVTGCIAFLCQSQIWNRSR